MTGGVTLTSPGQPLLTPSPRSNLLGSGHCLCYRPQQQRIPFLPSSFSKDGKYRTTLGRRLPSSCAHPMGEWREESLIKSQRQGTLLTSSGPARGFDTPFLSLMWPRPKEGKKGQHLGENEHQRSFHLAYLFTSLSCHNCQMIIPTSRKGEVHEVRGFEL